MKITVLTLFPEMISGFLNESIVKRAQDKKQVEIEVVNLRDFATDNYKTVDDRPYGGGAGMILMAKPIVEAISSVSSRILLMRGERSHKNEIPRRSAPRNDGEGSNQKIILTSPRGTVYTQNKTKDFSKLDHLIIIAGHYEGVDERVLTFVDEEVSLGDFVLTGGEIAAAAIIDSVVRLLPGVLKKSEAVEQESYMYTSIYRLIEVIGEHKVLLKLKKKGVTNVKLLEYPHYTRPEEFKGQKVPQVLLSGNHEAINKWRLKQAFALTLKKRKVLT